MHDIICLIPARSGSKGLKNKNIKPLNKVPLLMYPYKVANKCKFVKDIAVTSDSKKYLNFFEYKKVFKILRPKKISQSKSIIYDVIIHALLSLQKNYKYIVLLEPTSPLTSSKEIDKAIKLVKSKKNNISSVVSVVSNHKFLSVFRAKSNKKTKIKNFNRQEFNQNEFYFSGNFYVAKIDYLKKIKSFVGKNTHYFPIKDSMHTDIDDLKDFMIAEMFLQKKLFRFK